MSLDGLRAWIGEVERKLGVRTKVMLVLAVIAIGGAGAAIYLAVDTRNDAVSESDVRELQQELEAQIGAGGVTGAATDVTQLESELRALQAEVAELRSEGAGKGKGATGAGASTGSGATGSDGVATNDIDDASEKLRELTELAEDVTKKKK